MTLFTEHGEVHSETLLRGLFREAGLPGRVSFACGTHSLRRSSHLLDFPVLGPYGAPLSAGHAVTDLILNVDALGEANQPFEANLPRDFLEGLLRAEPPTEFHAAGKAHLRGETTKMNRKVLVRARFTVPLEGQCKRCLRPVALEEKVEIIRTYVRAEELREALRGGKKPRDDRDEEGTAASFDPSLVDEDPYEGKEINLEPALREQILLSLPPPPLCSEDCQGLCPLCGKDLNEGDCGHDKTVPDPRWAALKSIQLEKKEN
jgi:DUF177 domain-containing protein